jgi:hypothetical protein
MMMCGIAVSAFAAESNRPVIITSEMSTSGLHLPELTAFGNLTTANPMLAHKLTANPRLVKSRSFMKKNPELARFFDKFPGSKDRFLNDPGNYLPGVRMAHGRVVSWHRPAHKAMAEKSGSSKEKSGKSEKSMKMEKKGMKAKSSSDPSHTTDRPAMSGAKAKP